jgi:hypothetical protein
MKDHRTTFVERIWCKIGAPAIFSLLLQAVGDGRFEIGNSYDGPWAETKPTPMHVILGE